MSLLAITGLNSDSERQLPHYLSVWSQLNQTRDYITEKEQAERCVRV
ncbi:hypothetical protein N478_04780 [Pseudoalteromonas luteoviolacea S4060-1]|uniref:Uncharacterized protein n=1 Tax=Pseudoalteromonas luteoviolacea S4060-1 TaxID=1365257 RepID=A0A167JMY8_9GAMM|nr:hypothetical protein N478_04780 [Pseudoalteromonas luteoviolacea S4060-1]